MEKVVEEEAEEEGLIPPKANGILGFYLGP